VDILYETRPSRYDRNGTHPLSCGPIGTHSQCFASSSSFLSRFDWCKPTALTEPAFSRDLVEQVKTSAFSYDGAKGPLNWFGLNETTNAMCAEGEHQSPINLALGITQFNATPSTFHFSVPDVTSATFEDLGTNVEVIKNGSTCFKARVSLLFERRLDTEAVLQLVLSPLWVSTSMPQIRTTRPPSSPSFSRQ